MNRGRIRKTSKERASMAKGKVKILFVCIGNMVRSQMAEGFARGAGSAFAEVYSAGLSPTGSVSDEAIFVMRERGIDISGQRSKGLSNVPVEAMDYIVNMSGYPNEVVFPKAPPAKLISWEVADPLGGNLDRFRRVRDLIESKVEELLRELWAGGPRR